MNAFVRFALTLANMPTATINELEKALPGIARFAACCRELAPIFQKLEPLYLQAEPLLVEAYPIVKKAYPDFMASLPASEHLIEFVESNSHT
jgi:hypothetical protein